MGGRPASVKAYRPGAHEKLDTKNSFWYNACNARGQKGEQTMATSRGSLRSFAGRKWFNGDGASTKGLAEHWRAYQPDEVRLDLTDQRGIVLYSADGGVKEIWQYIGNVQWRRLKRGSEC